jgi:hypothetical protein
MAMEATPNKLDKKSVLRGIEDLLDLAEIADNVEFTVKISKGFAPTISYNVDGFPLFYTPAEPKTILTETISNG